MSLQRWLDHGVFVSAAPTSPQKHRFAPWRGPASNGTGWVDAASSWQILLQWACWKATLWWEKLSINYINSLFSMASPGFPQFTQSWLETSLTNRQIRYDQFIDKLINDKVYESSDKRSMKGHVQRKNWQSIGKSIDSSMDSSVHISQYKSCTHINIWN